MTTQKVLCSLRSSESQDEEHGRPSPRKAIQSHLGDFLKPYPGLGRSKTWRSLWRVSTVARNTLPTGNV